MTGNLNYIGTTYSINWLSVLFAFSIIQWLLIGYLVWNNHKKLYSEKFLKKHLNAEGYSFNKYIGFKDDLFFWFWNIYPIVFYLHFFYVESSWPKWMERLYILDTRKKISDIHYDLFSSSTSFNIELAVIFIIIGFSFYGAFIHQNIKHNKHYADRDVIYWWSSNVNNKIYVVRLVFLFTNLVVISFLTFLMLKISFFILQITLLSDLTVIPLHPDGNGGLKVISEILAIIIAMYLLRATMGVIGLDDHRKQGAGHIFFDLYNISYFPLAIAFSIIVYNKLKYQFTESYKLYDSSLLLSAQKYKELKDLIETSINNSSLDLKTHIDKLNEINLVLENSKFIVDISIFYNTVFSITAPLSIWFIVSFFNKKFTGK